MRPHWTEKADAMAGRISQMQRVLVASDFDGTLSELVDQPESARLHPNAGVALLKLSNLQPRVQLAFLSGRSLHDLKTRLPAISDRAALAGNHGLEICGGGLNFNHPAGLEPRSALDALSLQLNRICRQIAGVELEDKGLSLTLHYRRISSRDLILFERRISQLWLAENIGRHSGKMVVEFRPRVDWNKGHALRLIMHHLGIPPDAVFYLGDDQTDEDAFSEIAGQGHAVHVGNANGLSRAALNARDPEDAAKFLQWLAERLTEGQGSAHR